MNTTTAFEDSPSDAALVAAMRGLLGDDPERAYRQMAGNYLVAALTYLGAIRRAATAGEPRPVARSARALREASLRFGARGLASLCKELEEQALSGRAVAPEALGALEDEFTRVRDGLTTAARAQPSNL